MSQLNEGAIAARRAQLEAEFEGEFDRWAATESRVRRSVGTNMFTKGRGHRTIGAKAHGKSSRPVSGTGYGNYRNERLHRTYRAA